MAFAYFEAEKKVYEIISGERRVQGNPGHQQWNIIFYSADVFVSGQRLEKRSAFLLINTK